MTVDKLELQDQDDSEPDFGFWLYLMSDATMFGLIFATFVVMSHNYAGGPSGADIFSLKNLALQTGLLLTSSLTIGLAHRDAQGNSAGRSIAWLVATFALGAGFLYFELHELIGFVSQGAGPATSGYLSAFFTLVGTHGLHVAVGLVWVATMVAQLLVKGPNARVRSRLLRLTMFWHLLDIVWIGVFSLVYLPELL